ncbi:RAPGEF1 [Cervus elaphus hippelaphus]|uniref:RAPGEF1 n=1 Tax=Cervus elaphus hippelaphus TaxID=46360 RepID=A0A212CVM1_CEREH|nr:RAPGEF1 [Cervus elaphus hippelaphus]
MQLLEDYSEPQPSMFYQTPQKEHVYQQKNKLLMEVYGFNDSFSAGDAPHELAPPPALPPKQRLYQQKNKLLMEVYGFNDSFSAGDAPNELAPPPALPPKQRQLASYAASSFSSVSYCVQQTKVAFTPEDGSAGQGISVSVSNSFLSRHGSLPVPSED